MVDITFREYTAMFVLAIGLTTLMLNFSGSMFKTYNTNVSSSTLQQIKKDAQAASPGPGTYSNRTRKGIDIDESSFLSPDAFGIVQDLIGSAGQLGQILDTAVAELGLPKILTDIIQGVILLGLIFQGLSLLFGYNA